MASENTYLEFENLAKDILKFAQNTILISLPYLDLALYQMKIISLPKSNSIGMDGKNILYDFIYVLNQYKNNPNNVGRIYLHMLFHCIFYHPFNYELLNKKIWNIACDIAVENVILGLKINWVETPLDSLQLEELKRLKKEVGILTAEKIYRYFLDNLEKENKIEEYAKLFYRDNHKFWLEEDEEEENLIISNLDSKVSLSSALDGKLEWKKISQRVKTDLEMFSKNQGDLPDSLKQNIQEVNRERYNYEEFLRKFVTLGENIQVNDDEFDYILYTYGMELYQNMPLIEPLEYKEVQKIKDFVIALDTSGSCSGEVVQAFLNKTYNLLNNMESFFTKINLHIIQCDAKVQKDNKITSKEEFKDYLENESLVGFGGTDFRPVFYYVDDLIQKGEFTDLKGLIYFTDGYGEFPKFMPSYPTAFVFVEDNYKEPLVPVWAIKLVLPKYDILKNGGL